MKKLLLARSIFYLAMAVLVSSASATVIEVGDLNIINDSGNPSDGLRFLDMTYSDGLTLADALSAAQATYPNARLATPSEFDDLFAAAGISYTGTLTASDGFLTGSGAIITSFAAYDSGQLSATLGFTYSGHTIIWTDPDGDHAVSSTLDLLYLQADLASLSHSAGSPETTTSVGWLLVSEPVPEAGHTLALGMISLVGLVAVRRRIR